MLIKMLSWRCEFYYITQRATRCLPYSICSTPFWQHQLQKILHNLQLLRVFPWFSAPVHTASHHFVCGFVYEVTEFKHISLLYFAGAGWRVADASTKEQFHSALSDLEMASEWQQSVELHSWFKDTWLSQKKVGVIALHWQIVANCLYCV